jgi:hypothetical protein
MAADLYMPLRCILTSVSSPATVVPLSLLVLVAVGWEEGVAN